MPVSDVEHKHFWQRAPELDADTVSIWWRCECGALGAQPAGIEEPPPSRCEEHRWERAPDLDRDDVVRFRCRFCRTEGWAMRNNYLRHGLRAARPYAGGSAPEANVEPTARGRRPERDGRIGPKTGH